MAKKSPNVTYDKAFNIPVKFEMWKSLQKIAYENDVSMCNLIRDAIELHIKKIEKKG
jgi:hypothetical protein